MWNKNMSNPIKIIMVLSFIFQMSLMWSAFPKYFGNEIQPKRQRKVLTVGGSQYVTQKPSRIQAKMWRVLPPGMWRRGNWQDALPTLHCLHLKGERNLFLPKLRRAHVTVNTDFWISVLYFINFSAIFTIFMCVILPLLNKKLKSDVWLTVHRNSVWIRKTN